MEVSEDRVTRYGRDQDKGFDRRFPMLKALKWSTVGQVDLKL